MSLWQTRDVSLGSGLTTVKSYIIGRHVKFIDSVKFFLQELSEDDRNYVLQYLSSGKGCFPYKSVTGFNSLSATPDDGDFWTIDKFYSRLRDEEISPKE